MHLSFSGYNKIRIEEFQPGKFSVMVILNQIITI